MSTSSAATELGDLTMINVVGHENPYPYGKVKDAVLKLGGDFYFKHDTNHLVKVKDPSGKKRFFRKKSKLIHEIAPGKFIHKAFLIRTEDGIFLDKSDPDTVLVNGKPTRRAFTAEVDGVLYLQTDPRLRQCVISRKWGLVDKMVQLHPQFYKEWLALPEYTLDLVNIDGGLVLPSDIRVYLDKDGNEVECHRQEFDKKSFTSVFHKFRDSTNPQLDRIDYIGIENKYADTHTVGIPELGCRAHKNHVDKILKIYNEVILLREATATAALKKALSYADDGPDENQAKVVKKIPQPWPGKYNIFTPKDMSATISRTCVRTGGLRYTYGVELETAQGRVPDEILNQLKLKAVGDRSINAAEYVTGILHGDAGMDLLQLQCNTVAKYCLVDDKCGVHVHVAGMKDTKGVAPVKYDRHFAQYAVALGAQIEPELFATCPPSRYPTLKHCHSIIRWKDINDKNWREYLGALVFGPLENWAKPWSFAPYTYGVDGRTKNNSVGDWAPSRYKWLNLIHILTRSRISTCELRIFPGSTNFEKIQNYVLLSMAFVWFVENRANRIVKGDVTLNEMLMSPFEKNHPDVWQKLIAFYAERAAKFKRTDLYPKTIPKAIF